jgi:Tol biopolymer transport system component
MTWGSPEFSPDGKWITFHGKIDQGSAIAVARPDGTEARCLTCDSPGNNRRPIWLRDGKRILFSSNQVFRIVDVETRQLFEVEGIRARQAPLEMDRWPIVSPDGRKICWTKVWPDGFRIVMGDLSAGEEKYRIENLRQVWPPPIEDEDDLQQWAQAYAWYENKSFTDGGRTLLFASSMGGSGNLDLFTLDLETKAIRRLTTHPEWDEGGEFSPDGRMFVFETTRAHEVLSVGANVPIPTFLDYVLVQPFTRITLFGPYQAHHEVYLLDRAGDCGSYSGQRLSRTESGFAVRNGPHWSPDGTKVIWGEVSYDDDARRLRLLTFPDRSPQTSQPIVRTPDPAWAPLLSDVRIRSPKIQTQLRGAHSGTVDLIHDGMIIKGNFSATYADYSDDGEHVLNGSIGIEIKAPAVAEIKVDINLAGTHRGWVKYDLSINNTDVRGTMASDYDGRKFDRTFEGAPPR